MEQINDVRSALFNQLKRLEDPNLNLEKEIMRATAIVDVTKTIIDSAKVEVAFMAATGSLGSGFMPIVKTLPEGNQQPQLTAVKTKQLRSGTH